MPMLVTLERPAVLRDVMDVPERKALPMLFTPVRPVVSMDVMDPQPRRKLLGILVLLWAFVRVTFPEGQGDHLEVVVL